jgi:hypothetical protein
MHNEFKISYFVAYTPLNMFRALLCPSSGAPSNRLCSHWLPYDCLVGRVSSCVLFTGEVTVCVGGALSRRHRPTCFGHCCAHHQQPTSTVFAATGYRMIAWLDVFQAGFCLLVRLQCVLAELCRLYTAQHVSGAVVPIISSPLQPPLQPLVTV